MHCTPIHGDFEQSEVGFILMGLGTRFRVGLLTASNALLGVFFGGTCCVLCFSTSPSRLGRLAEL